jgi:hypothetical protein
MDNLFGDVTTMEIGFLVVGGVLTLMLVGIFIFVLTRREKD